MIHLKRLAFGLAVTAIGLTIGCAVTLAYYGDPIPMGVLFGLVLAYAIGYSIMEDK